MTTNENMGFFKRFIHCGVSGCSYLPWSDFDVEVVPLVGNFQHLWPGKSVYSEPVSVYQETARTDSKHDFHSLRVLEKTRTVFSAVILSLPPTGSSTPCFQLSYTFSVHQP